MTSTLPFHQQCLISCFLIGVTFYQPFEPVALLLANTLARARPRLALGVSEEVGLLAGNMLLPELMPKEELIYVQSSY